MKYYGFEHIYHEYSKEVKATKENERDLEKMRAKFVEIVKLVGINDNLLCKHKDEKTGEMVSLSNARSYCFPETICSFCVEIIAQYTSSNFKALRKRQYTNVAIDKLDFLIEGFVQYLTDLGYDDAIIAEERFKMDERLKYHFSVLLYELNEEYKALVKNVENCNSETELYYADKALLSMYIIEKVKQCYAYIDSVYSNYKELRLAEIDNYALENSEKYGGTEALTDISQSALLAEALEHDKEYQNLLNKQIEIIATTDFLKKLETPYNKNNKRLNEIRGEHIRELFGDAFQEIGQVNDFIPSTSISMLYDAVVLADEGEEEKAKSGENGLTEEQRKGLMDEIAKHFPELVQLPGVEQIERKIRKKGAIKFPCCPKEEITVFEGADGCIINKCPRCSKQIKFNLGDMTADVYEIPKGHVELS